MHRKNIASLDAPQANTFLELPEWPKYAILKLFGSFAKRFAREISPLVFQFNLDRETYIQTAQTISRLRHELGREPTTRELLDAAPVLTMYYKVPQGRAETREESSPTSEAQTQISAISRNDDNAELDRTPAFLRDFDADQFTDAVADLSKKLGRELTAEEEDRIFDEILLSARQKSK